MTTIVIENIPLPGDARKPKCGRVKTLPFEALQVGQSFLVPSDVCPAGPVRSRAGAIAKKLKRQYTVRAVDGGVRVYRIE